MNRRVLLLPAAAVLVAAAVWLGRRASPIVVPAVEWRLGAADSSQPARNYDEVPPETRVRLWFRCDEPRHVYVFSHSAEDGTLLLFPSPDVRSDVASPVPPGAHVLPGARDGRELAWDTRRQVLATTTFVVVAARAPVPELEQLLPRLRRWTNTARTDGSMQVTNPPSGTELAAGPRTPWPAPLLQAAAALSGAPSALLVNGPLQPARDGVWFGSVRVKERAERR